MTYSRFTVVYTCINGYRSFQSIVAANAEDAGLLVEGSTYNFGRLVEVLPFVGNY